MKTLILFAALLVSVARADEFTPEEVELVNKVCPLMAISMGAYLDQYNLIRIERSTKTKNAPRRQYIAQLQMETLEKMKPPFEALTKKMGRELRFDECNFWNNGTVSDIDKQHLMDILNHPEKLNYAN